MAVCSSINCEKAKTCAKCCLNIEGTHTARYYDRATDKNGKFLCGKEVDYPLYKKINRRIETNS